MHLMNVGFCFLNANAQNREKNNQHLCWNFVDKCFVSLNNVYIFTTDNLFLTI